MGLCIHYRGSFNKESSLSGMIEEIKDIAMIHKWPYHIFETEFQTGSFDQSTFDRNLYGICFTPPGCETVDISFLSNGRMSSAVGLQLWADSKDETEQQYLYMLSVKTQYAGIQTHKLIIELFRYLNKKYFTNFHLIDEGQYWETGDEKLLTEIFARYTNLINSFASNLETIPLNEGETIVEYLERMFKQIQSGKKK